MSRPGSCSRWCVPDLAFATACVTLFYCLFLFQGYQKLFRDSDAGWHIRTGEAILATGNSAAHRPLFVHPRRPALVRLGMARGCRRRAASTAPWDSKASRSSTPPRSPRASGSGFACTGRWAATS